MDRLLIPLHARATWTAPLCLDVDTLVLDDVCRLARTDLGDRPVGARDTNVSETSEWRRAGTPLEEALATEAPAQPSG